MAVARAIGRIDVGCFADFVLLDDDLVVQDTWIHGVAASEAPAARGPSSHA